MKHLLFVLALFVSLAGCNTPGPHFRDLPATRISVDGSVFDIRVRGELAEAMRINPEYAPRFGPIKARAAFAFEAVSGCRLLRSWGIKRSRRVCWPVTRTWRHGNTRCLPNAVLQRLTRHGWTTRRYSIWSAPGRV